MREKKQKQKKPSGLLSVVLHNILIPLKEEEMTEDEIAEWHHWLNGHECEQALGDGER